MNYWAQKRVLVTGATGFLGSWMTATLLDRGATVVALVRDLSPQSDDADGVARARCTAALGRLEDFEGLLRIVNEYEIDTVFHLGAQAIVGTANRNPLSTFEANIRGTWNLLEACRQAGTVKRIVVASSDKAYGSQPVLPYTEEMPLQGCHPYDVSKSCTDLIAHTYHVTYKLPVCITRCGNFFGGRDMNFNRIVPDTIRSVVFGKAPVLRSDGTFIRDYIYVKDVVNAYMVLAEKMDRLDIHGQAFNFSNEDQLTVLGLTSKILQLMDRSDLEPVILNQTQGEIRDQHLSAAKARAILDWKPAYSIDEALIETIEWYRGYFAEMGAALTSSAAN